MKRLRFLGISIALLLSPILVRATDTPVFPTGPTFQLANLAWGTSTVPGFNNNYFFTPLALNESVCVYVYNNNPTNAHAFTGAISITGNPNERTPSDGAWLNVINSTQLSAAISPGLPAGFGTVISGASQVSINLSASTTQAGSPDTATVVIAQTSGNCFSGQNFISSSTQSITAAPVLLTMSDGLSQSYWSNSIAAVNPATGTQWLLNANSGAKNVYLYDVTISCTVACSFNIGQITGLGTTCTSTAGVNQKNASTLNSTAIYQTACATYPGLTNTGRLDVGSTTPYNYSLLGEIFPIGTTQGFTLQLVSAVTGSVTVTYRWYEK